MIVFKFDFLAKQDKSSDVSSRKQLLRLALAWDAIEVAKELIIKEDLSDFDVSYEEFIVGKQRFLLE